MNFVRIFIPMCGVLFISFNCLVSFAVIHYIILKTWNNTLNVEWNSNILFGSFSF